LFSCDFSIIEIEGKEDATEGYGHKSKKRKSGPVYAIATSGMTIPISKVRVGSLRKNPLTNASNTKSSYSVF
jgi:hypothetical protein